MDSIRTALGNSRTVTVQKPGLVPRQAPRPAPSVVALAGIAAAAVVFVVLVGEGGLSYYLTPLRVRAYAAGHALLRPSGAAGRAFGVAGALMMFGGTLAYVARKHLRVLANAGSLKTWLEVHIFFGILGPVLVTLHTSFKFNGLISVAYWSMLLVVSSGFVGRYLYVRIPRTIRGVEMDRAAIEARAATLRQELVDDGVSPRIVRRIEELERTILPAEGARPRLADFLFGERRLRRRVRAIEREIRSAGLLPEVAREACRTAAERVVLLRRAATLELTRRLFALWHVFHKPFVWVLAAIFVVHVGVAIYFGYATGVR